MFDQPNIQQLSAQHHGMYPIASLPVLYQPVNQFSAHKTVSVHLIMTLARFDITRIFSHPRE